MTAREKGMMVLIYVGKHRERIEGLLLRKWGCRNRELLRDAIGECLIKVYDSIIRRDTEIIDIEKYFLRAARTLYVRMEKKEKKLHGLDSKTEEDQETRHSEDREAEGL